MLKFLFSACCRWSCCVGIFSQNNHKVIHTHFGRTQARNHDLTREHITRSVPGQLGQNTVKTTNDTSSHNAATIRHTCMNASTECRKQDFCLFHILSHFALPSLFLFPLVCFHVSRVDMTSPFRPSSKVSQFRFYHSPSVSQPTNQSSHTTLVLQECRGRVQPSVSPFIISHLICNVIALRKRMWKNTYKCNGMVNTFC